MGTTIFSEFRDELRLHLFNRTDTTIATGDTRLNLWINQTYRHVAYPSVYSHREMETVYDITLVLDDAEYGIDATTVGFQIVAVRNMTHWRSTPAARLATTQKIKLNPRPISWLDNKTLTTGFPSSYAIYGEELFLDATPNSTVAGELLRVRVWREPAALVADGATTDIPTIWDEVIMLGSRWRAERDLGYQDRAELTKQNYAALLNEYAERQDLEVRDIEWQPGVNHGASVMG